MEMPTLPTDNLYKFLALTGLVSLLFCVWFFENRVTTASMEQLKSSGELRLLAAEVDMLNRDVTNYGAHLDKIENQLTNALEMQKRWKPELSLALTNLTTFSNLVTSSSFSNATIMAESERVLAEIRQIQSERDKRMGELTKRISESVIKKIEWDNKLELQIASINHLAHLWKMARLGLGFAIVWTTVGFLAWFWRVQIYQDRILRNEALHIAPKRKALAPLKEPKPL
jgi:hypothetical protein